MKKQYNLVGGGFNNYDNMNKASSIHKQESKYIEWVNCSANETFYVDRSIGLAFDDDNSLKKYGWLLESKNICPDVNEDVKRNVHPMACKAAYLASCLKDYFHKVHDEIFENQGSLSTEWLS